jgi:hypothetical protein
VYHKRGEEKHILLVEMSEVKRPLGRLILCRWADNIRMHLGGTGWDGMEWIGLAQDNTWKGLVT